MTFTPRIATAVISACLFIAAANLSHSAEVSLSWEAPTSNTDGSPVGNIEGYKVHVGTAPGSYTRNNEAGNQTASTVSSLTEGQTYYFAVTAYDQAGTESEFSNELSYTVPAATPAPTPAPVPAPVDPKEEPAPVPVPSPPPVIGGIAKGDVDGNGVVAMPDVLAALQIAVGDGVFSPDMKSRADVWPLASELPLGDGKVTLDDCLAILRKVVQPGAW